MMLRMLEHLENIIQEWRTSFLDSRNLLLTLANRIQEWITSIFIHKKNKWDLVNYSWLKLSEQHLDASPIPYPSMVLYPRVFSCDITGNWAIIDLGKDQREDLSIFLLILLLLQVLIRGWKMKMKHCYRPWILVTFIVYNFHVIVYCRLYYTYT